MDDAKTYDIRKHIPGRYCPLTTFNFIGILFAPLVDTALI